MPAVKSEETKPEETKKSGHYLMFRRILLATIGAAAIAQDEFNEFIDRLVERGEIADKEGNKLRDEIKIKRGKFIEEIRARREKWHSPLATKGEIEALEAKINALEKKISELKAK
jgi:polyhydroxyalkanoate synthesis regulator phasin